MASVEPYPITVVHFKVNVLSVMFVASNSCGRGGKISRKEVKMCYAVITYSKIM